MQYKRYTVQTFERELGKWRASVRRTNGRRLWAGRAKIRHFGTGIDATTPQRAMQMALAAIDRGAFSSEPSHGRQMRAAASGAGRVVQQFRQLRKVRRDPPRLVLKQRGGEVSWLQYTQGLSFT